MSVEVSTSPPPSVTITPGDAAPSVFVTINGGPPGPEGREGPQGEGIQSDNWPDFTLIFENKLV